MQIYIKRRVHSLRELSNTSQVWISIAFFKTNFDLLLFASAVLCIEFYSWLRSRYQYKQKTRVIKILKHHALTQTLVQKVLNCACCMLNLTLYIAIIFALWGESLLIKKIWMFRKKSIWTNTLLNEAFRARTNIVFKKKLRADNKFD